MSRLSPYNDKYFCSSERIYIPKEEAVIAANGQPLCPNIHKWRQLRIGPRSNRCRGK